MAEAEGHIVPLIYHDVAPLPERAAVGIIGGGVMGTSIAFHLAEAGVGDIVVIERDTLGSGSSAKPLGGVRATFSDPGNIQLGQRSLEAFERFHETFKTDIGLQQVGYLFLCRNEAELAALENTTGVQRRSSAVRFLRVMALQSRPRLLRPTRKRPHNWVWLFASTLRSWTLGGRLPRPTRYTRVAE